MPTLNEDLTHHGVKGQKWGVRREHLDAVSSAAKKANDATPTKSSTSQTKKTFNTKVSEAGGLHKISDADLKKMLGRLDMERKYNSILNEEKAARAKHAAAVGKVLLEVGKIAVPLIVAGVAAKKVSDAHPGVFKATVVNPRVIEGVAKILGR